MIFALAKVSCAIAVLLAGWLTVDLLWQRVFAGRARCTGCKGCRCARASNRNTPNEQDVSGEQ